MSDDLNQYLSRPIPTKFDEIELGYLHELKKRTDYNVSQLIRLCVYLFYRDCQASGNETAFLAALSEQRKADLLMKHRAIAAAKELGEARKTISAANDRPATLVVPARKPVAKSKRQAS